MMDAARAAACVVLLGAGCAPALVALVDADEARAGAELGARGPHGAVLVERALRVRGDRVVDVELVLAADAASAPLSGLDPVLLLHGGAAPARRYRWLAAHLATRGAAVVVPRFLFDLPFFADADADDALAAARLAARDPNDDLVGALADADATIIGHSLGAVVAAAVFEREPAIDTAVLLSGYPADAALSRADGRVVSLVGREDGLVEESQVAAGVAAFAAPAVGAVIDGLTHYQLTDDPTPGELENEGTVGDDLEVARARALFLIDAAREAPLVAFDAAQWPAGVLPLTEEP